MTGSLSVRVRVWPTLCVEQAAQTKKRQNIKKNKNRPEEDVSNMYWHCFRHQANKHEKPAVPSTYDNYNRVLLYVFEVLLYVFVVDIVHIVGDEEEKVE